MNKKMVAGYLHTHRVLALGSILFLGETACTSHQPEPAHQRSPNELGEKQVSPHPDPASNSQTVEGDPSATKTKPRKPSGEVPKAHSNGQSTQKSLDSTSAPSDSDVLSVAEVSEEEIDAFSACLLRLGPLEQRFQQRAQSGESSETLSHELQRRALSIIEEEGLTLKRYQQIAQRVQRDPQLQEKVKRVLQARGSG